MKLTDEAKYFETRYTEGTVQLYEGLTYNTRTIIKTADFYSLSRYLGGQKDELQRDKPFYNTVNFRVTLAKTATEFDIKDFVLTSDDINAWTMTMLLNKEAYKWMKNTRFSRFLNKYAYVRPKYGGVIYKKKFEKIGGKDELVLDVCDWRNIYTDPVNIIGSPIIEKHYLTPLDFIEKRGVWNNIDEVMELFEKKREEMGDSAPGRLEVWEMTGVFDDETYKSKEEAEEGVEETVEEDKYYLQKHYMVMDGKDEIWLYSTKPKDLDYRYLAWEEVPGRGLGRGIIEESEEGQVWVNDLIIKQKNTMDIAGKVLIKTDADNIANNILEVDDGKIFKLEDGRDMAAIQLAPAALGNFQNIIEMWNAQMDKATSSFDANTGEQPPSGTPYSQTALLNQVAQRPFAFRQEEAGIDLEEMFMEWVFTHLIKRLEGNHILTDEFTEDELDVIDEAFGNKVARQTAVEMAMAFQPFNQTDVNNIKQMAIDNQQKTGAVRSIRIPKGYFSGWEGRMTLNITNEQKNKANILTSLSSIMQTVQGSFNPQTGKFTILEDPVMARLFGMIIDTAGVPGLTPATLGISARKKREQAMQTPMMQMPQPAMTPQQEFPAPVAPQPPQPAEQPMA